MNFNSCRNYWQSCWPRSCSRACQYWGNTRKREDVLQYKAICVVKVPTWPSWGHFQLHRQFWLIGSGWELSHPVSNCVLWRSAFRIEIEMQKLLMVQVRNLRLFEWIHKPSFMFKWLWIYNLSTQSNIIVTCVLLVLTPIYKRLPYFAQCPNEKSEHTRLP